MPAAAVVAATAAAGMENAAAVGSSQQQQRRRREELREEVYRRVLSSNILPSVKAHLRARLFAELKRPGGSAGGGGHLSPHQHPPATLRQHVINSVVAEYLQSRRHKYSLSVFLAETGGEALPQLSRADTLRLAGVPPGTHVHDLLLAHHGQSRGAGGCGSSAASACDRGGGDHLMPHSPTACGEGGSLAEGMVDVLATLASAHAATEATEATAAAAAPSPALAPSSQQLQQRLQQIDDAYRQRSSAAAAAAEQSMAQRMEQYQRDCDTRCAAQLEQRLARLREGELAAARQAEAARCQQLVEGERWRLQAEHQERLGRLHAQVRRGAMIFVCVFVWWCGGVGVVVVVVCVCVGGG